MLTVSTKHELTSFIGNLSPFKIALFTAVFYALIQPFYFSQYVIGIKLLVLIYLFLSVLICSQILRFFNLSWDKRLSLIIISSGILLFIFKVSLSFYDFSWERIGTGVLALSVLGAIPIFLGKFLYIPELSFEYLESKGNYLYFYKGKELIKRERRTISSANDKNLIRCHRGYAINKDAISHVKNEKGRCFFVLNSLVEIPISKSYENSPLVRHFLSQ
jgi:hypothetical protein